MPPVNRFKEYMNALATAMRQELPDVSDVRAEFLVDDIPYVFTSETDSATIFVYAVIGALPQEEAERVSVFKTLLHAQFCFSESSGFSFGVDADDTFVLLQALINTDHIDEGDFVFLMEKFVKAANVWHKRLAETEFDSAPKESPSLTSGFLV